MNQNTVTPNMKQAEVQELIGKSSEVKCTCGAVTFQEAILLRKVSRLVTGAPKDMLIPIPVFVCSKCGEPIEELLPKELFPPPVITLA
jgi:hypothetical protein